MRTIDLGQKLEHYLNEIISHSVSLERDVADLKKVIRIMANAKALDSDGNVVEQYTQDDVDFIKRVVERVNVFNSMERSNE